MFNLFKNKIIPVVAVIAFLCYFAAAMIDTGSTIAESKALLGEYQEGIREQKEISDSLDVQEQNIGSDEHIEAVARDRLGLCKSDEKIFVDGVGN